MSEQDVKLENHEVRITQNADIIEEVKKIMINIKDNLLGRPSWAVCIIIALLSSIAVGSVCVALRSYI